MVYTRTLFSDGGFTRMKRHLYMLALVLIAAWPAFAQGKQDAYVAPPESLVIDGVPKIPEALAETAGRYAAFRSASLADWHPTRHEMLISTRFAETPQLHLVPIPGGARQQLTFFADSVSNGRFHPNFGDYIVFSKDVGGGEWYQLNRDDVATAAITLLIDGKSRSSLGPSL